MKFAKLEIRMVMAMFVMGYEYELVDSKGRIPERLPLLDHNNRACTPNLKSSFATTDFSFHDDV